MGKARRRRQSPSNDKPAEAGAPLTDLELATLLAHPDQLLATLPIPDCLRIHKAIQANRNVSFMVQLDTVSGLRHIVVRVRGEMVFAELKPLGFQAPECTEETLSPRIRTLSPF